MTEETSAGDTGENVWDSIEVDAAEYDKSAGLLTGDEPVNGADPTKSDPEPEIESGALMADAVQVTADLFAPNWNIQREESEALGGVYGKLLDKYMPDNGLDKYGLELSALMITAAVLKSRAGIPPKKPEKKEKSEKANTSHTSRDEKQDARDEEKDGSHDDHNTVLSAKAVSE